MQVSLLRADTFQVEFSDSLQVDKVHAEALCSLLRQPGTRASHSTDYSRLVLSVQREGIQRGDVLELLRGAAEERARQLRALLASCAQGGPVPECGTMQ